MNWQKSSYSGGGAGDACVEIATTPTPTRIAVRDSKAPTRAPLTFPAPAFAALVGHLKAASDE
ncbi:DUF397 domain-containing protein [Streptomyces sp. NPDC048281]|uniref:DUF397 domain-containing protein n=1 Tax=Streptomyces sp. NPDC048281 TaxID=3154715 RepID=UPI0034469BB5